MKKIVIADYESALEEDYSITIESIEEALGEPVDTLVHQGIAGCRWAGHWIY